MYRCKGALVSSVKSLERLALRLVHHDSILGSVGARAARPDSVDHALGCTYQGRYNSCTGHGFEKLAWGTAKAQGLAGERGDELGIYAFRLEGYVALGDVPVPDEGAEPAVIAQGCADFGVMAKGLGPTTPGDRLDLFQLEAAIRYRLTKLAHLNMQGDELVGTLLDALAANRIPCFTMPVAPAYDLLRPGDVYDGIASGPLHCQAIDAYRPGKDGIEFGVAGSWGPNWADGGRAWITQRFIGAAAIDVYIADVTPTIRRPS